MVKQKPNPLQKLVRGAIRDWINQVNSQKALKQSKPKAQKSSQTATKPDSKNKSNKRSRNISKKDRVSVLHTDGFKCVLIVIGAKVRVVFNFVAFW
ncbi:MAG: hypothetical protein F6K10_14605 [Moorea sp. SIO2B7]|nr:hypothetical protein [Moorena sp. SIO2B7]